MSDSQITVVEQKTVEFYDDEMIVVQAKDGGIYVPIRQICTSLGIDWASQRKRINRSPILSEQYTVVVVTTTTAGATDHQTKEMGALPLDFINGWLMGVNPDRVKSEIREPLLRYQRECYRILADAFVHNDVIVRRDDELMQSSEPSAIAFRNALALAQMARQQYYLEQRVNKHDEQLIGLGSRLALLEANMSNPNAYVSQEEAQLISEGVKMIAGVLSKRSGKNEYGGTYVELYRRFGVTSYKHIPAGRFDETMSWLRSWYSELTDDSDVPF